MPLGRMYSIIMESTSLSGAKTLARISAPTDAVLVVHKVKVTNLDIEASNQLSMLLERVTTDGTGTGATISPRQEGSPAFGGSAVVDLTAEPTGGALLDVNGENLLNGWLWEDTPEEQIVISPGERFAVRMPTAPAVATLMALLVIVEEIGG